MLYFKDLEIATDKKLLFKIEELELGSGIIALVGRNGAGKSTFFRSILGVHLQTSGRIEINGKSPKQYSSVMLAKQVAIVFSKSSLFGNHTGRDLMYLGRLPYQNIFAKRTEEDQHIVNEIINELDLIDFVDKPFVQLSDGERQLIMIGRAMVQNTSIILLDEPNAFLDLVNRHKVMEVLRKIGENRNKLVLFSTHDIEFLPHLCDQVLLIDNQKLIALNEKDQFIAKIKESFGINSKIK